MRLATKQFRKPKYIVMALAVMLVTFGGCKFADLSLRIKKFDLIHDGTTTALTNAASSLPSRVSP